jgi:hypothetical protein
MASKITAVQGNMLPEAFDIVQPLSSKSLFWQATYLTGSDAIDCLPFLFWTVESAAPQVLVSLANDTDKTAETYFAMCQAVQRLALETRCFNVAPDDPDSVIKRHNIDNFEDFSFLMMEPHAAAASRFGPQSIDLLYLDLARLPDDLAIWQDKLSPRSVVLIHGATNPDLAEARKTCLDQLGIKHIDFALSHGNGIDVILGTEVPARLERLSRLQLGVPGYSEVQKVFFRLGKAHVNAHLARHEHSARVSQQKELDHLRQQIKEATEALDTQRKKTGELRSTNDILTQQLAVIETRHSDEITALNDALKEAADTTGQDAILAEAQQRTRKQEGRLAELTDTVTQQNRELAEKEQQIEEVRADGESKHNWLRGQLEKYKSAEAKHQENLTVKTKEADSRKTEIAALNDQIKTYKSAEAEHQAELSARTNEADARKTEIAALNDQIETYKSAEAEHQAELSARTEEANSLKTDLAKAREQGENMLDKKTAQAEIASLNARVETQIDELVELTRLFEIEKSTARHALSDQKGWQTIQVELRDAEITMLRAGQSRLQRGDAASRAGLPSVKIQIETVRKSDLFDASWYLKTYPDVAQSEVDPARHYVLHGALDGRNPGPRFDTVAYYVANRDVAQRGFNALVHYALFGKDENRKPYKVS